MSQEGLDCTTEHLDLKQFCVLLDTIPPVVSDCPSDVILPLGITLANWTEPTVTDNSGNHPNVIKSHETGTSFTEGNTTVSYTFTDEAGNQAVCSFLVVGTLGRFNICFPSSVPLTEFLCKNLLFF